MYKERVFTMVSMKMRPTIIWEAFAFADSHHFLDSAFSRNSLASSSRISSDIEERQFAY